MSTDSERRVYIAVGRKKPNKKWMIVGSWGFKTMSREVAYRD